MKKFFCILSGVLFFITASVAGVRAEEQFALYSVPANQSTAAMKYWTKERMKQAKPRPTPKRSARVQTSLSETIEQSPGTPGYDPSYDPNPVVQGRHGAARPYADDAVNPVAATAANSQGYDYPPPHTTFHVLESLYGTTSSPFPYKAIGKVFFTDGGEDYICSGASIGGRAVLTAGHCVSDEAGHYFTNWIFVPSYNKEETPFGEWTATSFLTFASYHKGGDMARDVAFAIVKDVKGKKLSARVGYLGFAYNLPRIQHWSMFGYPGDTPYDGEYMVDTEASYAAVDTEVNPNTTGIGTNQTKAPAAVRG